MTMDSKSLPKVVSQVEWQAARDWLLKKEKAHTRAGDVLAAERRRLPMVKIDRDYLFEGPSGKVRLLDLFEGRSQLILYHFMFDPKWTEGCSGCSMVIDGIGKLSHLNARDVSFAIVSLAPQNLLKSFKKRMGWTFPWYSSSGSSFNADFSRTQKGKELSGTSVFLRDNKTIYRTYFTTDRGDESYMSTWKLLDLVPFGRQENWETSPEGWPQTPPYDWWRLHDGY
jgi:predicted dithiol-disulfide oxidoreductase (DUF899 family)